MGNREVPNITCNSAYNRLLTCEYVKLKKLISELKRRNVFRMALLYVVASWVILQAGDVLFGLLELPPWTLRLVFGILLLGLPVALLFSWLFELTPDGLKRETDVPADGSVVADSGRKLNVVTGGLAIVAIGLVVWQQLSPNSTPLPSPAQNGRTEAVPEAPSQGPTIAVLPFVNMSKDEQDFFADGITEEILNVLVKIDGLMVIGRTSSFQYKNKNIDLRDIGEQLGVSYLLEGSVRRFDNDLRITAQLVRSDNGFHLWSESYDRELANVFAIQDEIAQAIAQALKVPLGLPERKPEAYKTANLDAYDFYLQALGAYKRRGAGVEQAITLLREAVALDPKFAEAWALLSSAYAVSPYYIDTVTEKDWIERSALALETADTALTLNPNLVDAYAGIGAARTVRHEWVEADAALRKAISLDPQNANARQQFGEFLNEAGFPAEALNQLRTAVKLDPLTPIIQNALGYVALKAGDPDLAFRALRTAISLDAEFANVMNNLVRLGVAQWRSDALRLALQSPFMVNDPNLQAFTEGALEVLGQPKTPATVAALRELARRYGIERLFPFVGQENLFVDWHLEHGGEVGVPSVNQIANDKLLTHPKYPDVLLIQGLPAYWDQIGWPEFCRRAGGDQIQCGPVSP